MSEMAVCESCGERFDYGALEKHIHKPVKDLLKKDSTFRMKLERLINECSLENRSDTPDYLLADYMITCLVAYEKTVNENRKLSKDTGAGQPITGQSLGSGRVS